MKTILRSGWILSLILMSQAVLQAQTKDTILPSNPNIQYMGRVDFSNPNRPLFAYPNSTIQAKFQGTSLDLLLKHYKGINFEEDYFLYIIDGKEPVRFKVTTDQEVYPIVHNLTDGIHTIELIKISESHSGECEFLGFLVDAGKKLLKPEPLPDLKLEFYGNSITCGFGIEGGPQPLSDNSYKAYAAVASRELNAQFQTISYSGIGIVRSWHPLLMKDMYNRTIALTSYQPLPANNTWDFTRYIPDVVVIALGTNDFYLGYGNGSIPADTFKTCYAQFVNQIRTVYPKAQIVCTNSPMVSDPKLGIDINRVVTQFNKAGDKNIHYLEFSLQKGGGWGGHPGLIDGQTNGKELAAFIRTLSPKYSKNRK